MKIDEYDFTLVNLEQCVNDDPFVLSTQVKQVFYVLDPIDKGRYVVRKAKPRSLFDMQNQDDGDDIVTSSNIGVSPLSLDLAELDMLIVHTEDSDEADLRLHNKYNDGDGDDVADYDDEYNGVEEDLEEFNDIFWNEIDGDVGKDDIEYNDVNGDESG